MSMNSRYRERKYNTSDNDRLLRALSQPVQAWEKKWTQHSNSKTLQTYKWIKSDKIIEFEQDEESEEEPEAMEVEQTPNTTTLEDTATTNNMDAPTAGKDQTVSSTVTNEPTVKEATAARESQLDQHKKQESTTTEALKAAPLSKPLNDNAIPGGPSTILSNKIISSIQQEAEEDDDDQRSQTPKLDDISDVEDSNADIDDDDDNDVDSINDPSKHPALAPHAQARMTDDEMTDSTAATPQTTTEGNTPMPLLEDDSMEEPSNHPHPLSQEILTGATSFLHNNEDNGSLNNDSPAIQTPEDTVIHQQPAEAMDE